MAKLNLSAPWVTYYRETEELFRNDPTIRVLFDEEEPELKLYVNDQDKYEALTFLMPEKMEFANVTMPITIVPANLPDTAHCNKEKTPAEHIMALFFDNEALVDIAVVHGIFANDLVYVIFKKEVVQYFNDNLGDYNGVCSTLYQEIAKNVLKPQPGIFFCTSVSDNDIGLYNSLVHKNKNGKYISSTEAMWP